MKKNYVFLGVVAGVFGAVAFMFYMKLPLTYYFSPAMINSTGIIITLVSIVIPQYIYYQTSEKFNTIHLFLSGLIALLIMQITLEIFLPYLFDNLTTNYKHVAYAIGIGTVVSLVTAFLMRFIKKKIKQIPSHLMTWNFRAAI